MDINTILEDRLDALERQIAGLVNCDHSDHQFYSRRDLADALGCSERFIRLNPHFKGIECRIGGRVFYRKADVDNILINKRMEVSNEKSN